MPTQNRRINDDRNDALPEAIRRRIAEEYQQGAQRYSERYEKGSKRHGPTIGAKRRARVIQ